MSPEKEAEPANLAIGNFANENEAGADLDRRIEESGLFRIEREVSGFPVSMRPGCVPQANIRIDRIIIPTKKLLDMGWNNGAFGIECKNSGKDIGPAISQGMDYTRTVFCLEKSGILVAIKYVFLWPFLQQKGDLESVMNQNGIGTVDFTDCLSYRMFMGQNILRVPTTPPKYNMKIEWAPIVCGNRVGNRK